ncbi:3-oxoadipate enol-lactonase [Streptomyces sp. Amel2xB2]|uniref:alpha/beta fold hydrolase n=1 Tax=Streptomyces sp. Amel2xB2 TaxID=1305829 RepID=UPI000DC01166|nr:alpha/beta fold hydrolase [Streptomyces sp. Amel2xB2]RAJ56602.1 3-oxoadipate enol-lactonase [Streptomyces sp. Amel2xB2]
MLHHTVEGTGPDVVLLHGVGLDHRMWRRCVPELAAQHRVTAVDLRGHGASPAALPGTRLDDLAADVVDVLDHVGARRVHLVGFSLGALVAGHLAARHPSRVATVSLVSSVALRTEEEREAVLRRLEAARADPAATAEAAVERWFGTEWRRREPELAEEIRQTLLANDHASYLACYAVFATGDAEVGPLLEHITAPALAVTGGEDPGSTPEMSRRLAAAVPDASVRIVPGARHLLPLERPRELTAALTDHFERTTP